MELITILLFIFLLGVTLYVFERKKIKRGKKEHYNAPEYVAPPPGVTAFTIATDLDHKRALKEALMGVCKQAGYTWVELPGNEFVYDCKHTKKTCLRDSVKDDMYGYQEWRELDSKDAQEIAKLESTGSILSANVGESTDFRRSGDVLSNKEGVCILGNLNYKQFCEGEGIKYDPNDGTCTTIRRYCNKSLLAYCNGDCFEDPGSMLMSKVFGTTLGRSSGFLSFLATDAACNNNTPPEL